MIALKTNIIAIINPKITNIPILFGITNNNSSTNIIASIAIVPVIVPKYIFKSAFFDNFSYIFSLFLLFIKS